MMRTGSYLKRWLTVLLAAVMATALPFTVSLPASAAGATQPPRLRSIAGRQRAAPPPAKKIADAQNIRADSGRAGACENLLRAGVTLSGLSRDMQLTMSDAYGGVIERVPIDSAFLLADGYLADAFLPADAFLLADASPLADAFLLADSYVNSSALQRFDGRVIALQQPIQSAVAAGRFYADGIVAGAGNAYGGTVFSPEARAISSRAVLDPRSTVGVETTSAISKDDAAPIRGLGFNYERQPLLSEAAMMVKA